MTDPGILLTPSLVWMLAAMQGAGMIVLYSKVRVRGMWPSYDMAAFGLFAVAFTFVFEWTGFWQTGVVL